MTEQRFRKQPDLYDKYTIGSLYDSVRRHVDLSFEITTVILCGMFVWTCSSNEGFKLFLIPTYSNWLLAKSVDGYLDEHSFLVMINKILYSPE